MGPLAPLARALGAQTNTVVSKAYPTLVTPAGWAFSIWGIIYTLEGVRAACCPRGVLSLVDGT